ncbi:hypothetical protein ACVW19_000505 [Streptomyces sp. TE5632]
MVPGEGQPAALHRADDLQRVGTAVARVVVASERPVLGPHQAVAGVLRAGVPLAQVVEDDLSVRGPSEPPAHLGRAEGAQHTEAQAVAGHGAQLAAHRLHQGPPVPGGGEVFGFGHLEGDGVDGGEPADRAGEVHVLEDVLAAVSLQVQANLLAAGPAGQGQGEGGEQYVVDAGAVGGGRGA